MKNLGGRCLFLLAAVCLSNVSFADSSIKVESLSEAAVLSKQKDIPILLYFYDNDCENCESVNEEFIKPMINSGDYINKTVIYYVNMEQVTINSFNREQISMEDFSNHYNIELLPTAAFVDAKGNKLEEIISGVSNLEYYGSLLDEALELSLKRMRK